MKKSYSTPVIERNVAGFLNKYAYNAMLSYQDNIDNVKIANIIKEFGSPVFVFSEQLIRKRYRRFSETLQTYYPKSEITWSYKTNYLDAICSIYHQESAKAEVVSGMEYEKARRLGVKGSDIIFNGPGKKRHELELAVREGARIHVDHFDEIYLLEKISLELQLIPKIALRVNMDTGISPLWTRFGFNYENGEAFRAIQRIVTGKKLQLTGLHTHIGTFILDPTAYYWAANKLLTLAQTIKNELNVIVEYIDLGGGFASNNTLHAQYTPGDFATPSFDQYISSISNAFNESAFVREHEPRLILETGRVLIDEAGYLITSVLGKKYLPSGEKAVILDAGVNTNITAWWYKQRVIPAQPFGGTYQNTVFYGPLCMNIDVVRPVMPYPDVQTGQQLIIHPVGAYNVTQWMQFIEYRPNVVLISETGQICLIRERESLVDIVQREVVPEHLRKI